MNIQGPGGSDAVNEKIVELAEKMPSAGEVADLMELLDSEGLLKNVGKGDSLNLHDPKDLLTFLWVIKAEIDAVKTMAND